MQYSACVFTLISNLRRNYNGEIMNEKRGGILLHFRRTKSKRWALKK